MKNFEKESIETLSDVFAAWIGGYPETNIEYRRFVAKSGLEGIISIYDVENILFNNAYFPPEVTDTIYALIPPRFKLKNKDYEYALFRTTFKKINNKTAKLPISRVVNVRVSALSKITQEKIDEKNKYMEDNKTMFRNHNSAVRNPEIWKQNYRRRKLAMTEEDLAKAREDARIRGEIRYKEHREEILARNRRNRVNKKSLPTSSLEQLEKKIQQRKYYEEHKELISERNKARRERLREENPELLKAMYKRHNEPEKRNKRDKAYYLKHKDEISAKAKANPKTAVYKRRYKIKQRLKKTGPIISALLQGIINAKEK